MDDEESLFIGIKLRNPELRTLIVNRIPAVIQESAIESTEGEEGAVVVRRVKFDALTKF